MVVENVLEMVEAEREDKDDVGLDDIMATLRGEIDRRNVILAEQGAEPVQKDEESFKTRY